MKISLVTVALLLLPAASAGRAAPPNVTYLFPAGAQRGTTVEITVAGIFERWPVQAWASGCGVEVQPGKDKGKLTITVAADAVPGTYWLRLYDEQGASAPRPFIVGVLPEVREQEPNDDVKKPQRLDPSAVTVNGKLEKPGDVDCFAVQLRKGQTLVAALEANTTLHSPMDAVLQVVSADGFVLEENNDCHGLDPFIAFPVPKDGTYVVRTIAFPATPDSSIRFAGADTYVYRLTITADGYADYPVPLAVSRAYAGKVELVGWNLPVEAKRLPVPAGQPNDEATLFHSAVANPVRVRLEPHACTVKPPGAGPFALTPPVTVTGRIECPHGADVYTFPAKKGQQLVIRADSRVLSLPMTAGLRLADEAGKVLARAEPRGADGDPELAFTPPQDGTYRLTVRDLYGDGGPRAAYRLRLARPEPDFALSLKSDRFTVGAGKTLDLPVTVQRLNGFGGEIELSVEGLPQGVELATASDPKNKSLLTLKLTAKADTKESGPIRVVGKAKDGPALTRTATATVPEPGENAPKVSTPDLWLTVLPPADKKESALEKKGK
jgi:hypothetical protein